ncbi:bifunctional proline dehydrogenase/L-glutamate gamma-semialdehyde dehydrogenase PutA [Terrihabitans soli]|uniref:bifunctional proline dehydrogenase/L-glutamate gamma-semialdehyde dehydrogenase PutA n=1 Tax=Terrihabitans soli TaxID=708113 RepID=UPI003B83A03C
MRTLLLDAPLTVPERARIKGDAAALVRLARNQGKGGMVESFLQEFSLATREGLVLMCLAEALLRTPDEDTRDRLIAEKVASADWASHLGRSDNLFVSASTWGLMLTGSLVDVDDEAKRDLPSFLRRIAGRISEPVIRTAIGRAIRIMSEQFVLGRTIEEALKRADSENLLCSFDMLGEGARTEEDAERYAASYAAAIDKIGAASKGDGPEDGHGVSVKLSALSPRYDAVQAGRKPSPVWDGLYPRLRRLALTAAEHDINLTLDAEEADRLTISLEILDRLAREKGLGDWRGLGLAVQAYQKRAPDVIDAVANLSRDSGRRLMVRLVKGAYWDTEIKRAQIAGRPDYPVFSTKQATDLCFLVSAEKLIRAAPQLYPQFATHNAHTLAAIRLMASRVGVKVEYQRLHGMGRELYAAAKGLDPSLTVRTYAPVGGHEELLPYLVRRLLENGANTSFVHTFLDEHVAVEAVVTDPIEDIEANPGRHPKIPPPPLLFGDERKNSSGLDLTIGEVRENLRKAVAGLKPLAAAPLIGGETLRGENRRAARAPADGAEIGLVSDASPADMSRAIARARAAQPEWDRISGPVRAKILRKMADALETERERFIAILAREGGKTFADGISEVREAADFCRYYARIAENDFVPRTLPGPAGERNLLSLHGRGVFACISPWNFPLAIFTGQIAAALAAGNAVIAKPAEQTPLIAYEAVKLYHRAGLDPDLLHLVMGSGSKIGAALTADPGIDGVAFTGGTDTAWAINRALAAREGPIIPFIAETGGLNGMFVDTTALREQVIDDVILSAFGSAGQRCSALRLLFLPEDTADALIHGLKGAMDALVIGDPSDPATDVGPVIDMDARALLEEHMARLARDAKILHRLAAPEGGSFFPPVLAEIPSPDFLTREVFGPILHVVRYRTDRLEEVAAKLAAQRFGLTLGVHSRIDGFAEDVARLVPAGNFYVNRSMIGAVVGVQPFGGEGLSGTGPKAGGPLALTRYAVERATSINIAAQGGDPDLMNL